MKAIERHRQTWQGKSDEWLFERLDNELKQKVEEIHCLLAENEALRQFDVIRRSELLVDLQWFDIDPQWNGEFTELEERIEVDGKFVRWEDVRKLITEIRISNGL